jgi:hypothetical protein
MNEIYAAIFTRLNSQITEYPIFDYVPQDQQYPYIQVGELDAANDDTQTNIGYNSTIVIMAFADYKGYKDINAMSELIFNALHRYVMPDTATYGISTIHREFYTTVVGSSGVSKMANVRQGISRYRIIFEVLPPPS